MCRKNKWLEFPDPDDSLERECEEFLDAVAEGREPSRNGHEASRIAASGGDSSVGTWSVRSETIGKPRDHRGFHGTLGIAR